MQERTGSTPKGPSFELCRGRHLPGSGHNPFPTPLVPLCIIQEPALRCAPVLGVTAGLGSIVLGFELKPRLSKPGAIDSICSMTNLMASGCLSGGYPNRARSRLIEDRSLALGPVKFIV